MDIQPFVAIDFETANSVRGSACSIALVKYDSSGSEVDRFSTLLKPHESLNFFTPINIWIHGITEADVAHAPEWHEVVPQIQEFISDLPLVAHNMAFDGYVLKDLSELYGLELPTNPRLCTLRMARRYLRDDLESKTLNLVYDFLFPGKSFQHHDAYEDARACGEIFVHFMQQYGFTQIIAEVPPQLKPGERRRYSKTSDTSSTAEKQQVRTALLEQFGGSNILQGERVAFTGTLTHGKRDDMKSLVEELGGHAENSFTQKTTMLVIGSPNPYSFKPGSAVSSKMEKASAMREKGLPIQLLSETDFFNLISDYSEH